MTKDHLSLLILFPFSKSTKRVYPKGCKTGRLELISNEYLVLSWSNLKKLKLHTCMQTRLWYSNSCYLDPWISFITETPGSQAAGETWEPNLLFLTSVRDDFLPRPAQQATAGPWMSSNWGWVSVVWMWLCCPHRASSWQKHRACPCQELELLEYFTLRQAITAYVSIFLSQV